MKKWMKILAFVMAVLVALLVALIVLANVLITPERVKETLLPLAEEHLNRKLELGDIEVSFFSGIEIHGLTIYEQDRNEVFASTDLVRLKYQLLPLLAMKVVVDEVLLNKPNIRIVRLKDGQFNFNDLLGDAGNDDSKTDAAVDQSSGSTQSDPALSLLVSQMLLQDGTVTFLDHVLNDQAPYRYEISALQIAAKGVSFTGNIPLSVECKINGGRLSLDGHVSLLPLGGDFEVELLDLDVVAFNHYLQDFLPGKLGGVKLNFKSTISGTEDELALQGQLSFVGLDLLLDALPDAPLEDARMTTDFDLLLTKGDERIKLRQFDLDYNGIMVNTEGDVSKFMSKPVLDLQMTVPELHLRQALVAIPQGLVGDVGSLDPAGSVTVEAKLSGVAEDAQGLLKTATIRLNNVQATAGGQRPAFTGQLLFSDEQISSEGLQVRLGDNSADIDLRASNLFDKTVVVRADISSDRFLIESLLQGSAGSAIATDQKQVGTNQKQAGKNQKQAGAQEASSVKEIGPFDLPLHATGTINVAEALWKGLSINNFVAQYELKDNVLNLFRMDGQVAGGSFSNSARVDLGKKGLAYSAQLGLKTIQADPLLTAFVPKSAGSLLGAMDMNFALDGRGTEWQALSRNLSGAGDLLVSDGRLTSPALVNGLGSFLQLSELNDIPFDNFTGQFKVEDGKVKLDSQLLSSQLKLFPKGSVGLDGSLNLGMDTRLSPELSAKLDEKGKVSNYFLDNDGWTKMPLLLKGDFRSPSFGLDPKGVQEQASKALGNELGRQLNKLFKRSESTKETDKQPVGEGGEQREDPTQKLLQDSLQKLFGN